MLKVDNRPEWRTVVGGSSRYIESFRKQYQGQFRLNCPVSSVIRLKQGVSIKTPRDEEKFDSVIFACHSDQALRLLADPTNSEREVLGAMTLSGK